MIDCAPLPTRLDGRHPICCALPLALLLLMACDDDQVGAGDSGVDVIDDHTTTIDLSTDLFIPQDQGSSDESSDESSEDGDSTERDLDVTSEGGDSALEVSEDLTEPDRGDTTVDTGRDSSCDGVCTETCETAVALTMADVEGDLDELTGESAWIDGRVSSGEYPSCTEMECTPDDPCCNSCSIEVGFRTDRNYYRFDSGAGYSYACTGDNCQPFSTCPSFRPGEMVRVRATITGPETPIALKIDEWCTPNPPPPSRPQARMSWQAPGGFAGWGPALVVTGDGKIRIWHNQNHFDPSSEPTDEPSLSLDVGSTATDDLFALWDSTDISDLPHVGGSADCYPWVGVRLCTTCEWSQISYSVPANLTPEMEKVWGWFDDVLSAFSHENPRRYCSF